MDKNTVTLDLKTYNELRDFSTNLLKNNVYVKETWKLVNFKKFVTTNEAIKELVDECNLAIKKYEEEVIKNSNLISQFKELEKKLLAKKYKEITLEDIKKMSYWKFRKWRKSNE